MWCRSMGKDNSKLDRHESLGNRIEMMQRELSAMEQAYELSVRRQKGEDEEWNVRSAQIQNRINTLVKSFRIGDNGEKAIATVAQCAILATELGMPEHWIGQYKEKKSEVLAAQRDFEAAERRKAEMGT